MKALNVMIVDDHPFILSGLSSLINQVDNMNVVAKAQNGIEALKILKKNLTEIDIIFTDIEMPEMGGHELIDVLNKKYPAIKIIVITMHSHQWMIKKLLSKNITAIISKSAGEEDLRNAVNNIDKPNVYIDSYMKDIIVDTFQDETKNKEDDLMRLSKKEVQVLQLIYEGYSTADISEKLFKSIHTIETHRRNMFIKCDVKNIASLLRYGIDKGIIKI